MAPLGVTTPGRYEKQITVEYVLYGKPGLDKLLFDESPSPFSSFNSY